MALDKPPQDNESMDVSLNSSSQMSSSQTSPSQSTPSRISHWPSQERPREKLLQRGPDALSDAELLAIFLRTGVAGQTALDLARDLLSRFGGLNPLLSADEKSFCAARGLGQAKYVQLQAVLELSRRTLKESLEEGDAFTSPTQTAAFLKQKLRHREREVFAAMWLDSQHRLLAYQELFFGTINGAEVHPRIVVEQALKHQAAAAIICHNHPSGVAEPSLADRQITTRLLQALGLVDIRLLDHLVVGAGEPVSFAQRGWL